MLRRSFMDFLGTASGASYTFRGVRVRLKAFYTMSLMGLVLVCLLGASTVSYAQPAVLNEKRVVSAILQADPRLAQAKAQLELTQAQASMATPRWSPGAYYTLEHFGRGARLDREHEIGAAATWVAPHERVGQTQARIAQELARFDAQRLVHRQVLSGLRRFYSVVAVQEGLAALLSWEANLMELARIAAARVQAGDAPEYEQLSIELALRSAQSEIRVARSVQAAELQALVRFLGITKRPARVEAKMLPPEKTLKEQLTKLQDRSSVDALVQAERRAQQSGTRMGKAWIPKLSMNAGLRVRRSVDLYDWGFGLGISGAFPHPKRVQALRKVTKASERAMQSRIDATRFGDRQAALRSAQLCLALLEERRRSIKEIAEVLGPLERALRAGYLEGQRGVGELMDVLEQSMKLRRYHLDLAMRARQAELDFRDAQGVFEQ